METERQYDRKTGLIRLTDRDRENLLACVDAELAFLDISGKDYEGPLVWSEIAELRDRLNRAEAV